MKISLAIVALVVLQAGAPAGAQSVRSTFTVNGVGNLSCGQVLAAAKSAPGRMEVSDWVNGFITGYNYYNNGQLVTPPDSDTEIAFIDVYCQTNPLSNIVAGVVSLVDKLGGKKSPYAKNDNVRR